MIQFGCCINGKNILNSDGNSSVGDALFREAEFLKRVGYSYAEINAGTLNALSENELRRLEKANCSGEIELRTSNGFIPASLNIWDTQSHEKLYAYIDRTLQICQQLGIRLMVFGSGTARRFPDRMSLQEALQKLPEFLSIVSDAAGKYQVQMVIEPLNRNESNLINTVAQGASVVREFRDPRMLLLADAYHMFLEKEPLTDLTKNADIIRHVHVAAVPDRTCPKAAHTGADFLRAFASKLLDGGYQDRVTIECGYQNFREDVQQALPFLKEIFHAN